MAALATGACQEQTPLGVRTDLAAAPVTVELELAWSEFASNLEVFGGYGATSELGIGVVATDFAGSLNARTLMRFGAYPAAITVLDSTGTNRPDTVLTFPSGRLVAFFDTIASTNTGPVTLSLGALQDEWDRGSASWLAAVDTLDDLRLWPEAGAGAVTEFGTAVWDPATGDSVVFQLDSAELAVWSDPTDATRGARLELITTGERLRMVNVGLRVDARASIADTVVTVAVFNDGLTFVYDPFPQPPPDGVRIGGAPSWRTVLDIDLPAQLDGPPGFCAQVPCPYSPRAVEVSFAALVLTSRAASMAFQPTDTIGLDVRPVLSRAALPKSPLGSSLVENVFGRRVGPEAFGSQAGETIEIPITLFVKELLAGSGGSAFEPPNTLVLLSAIEPISIAFASFVGPGGVDEPRLRLVLTIGPAVELP